MKKTILSLLLLSAGLSYGQNFYNFTTSQSAYTDLAAPTSITNGQVWYDDDFGPFSIPFSFSVNGQAVNRFYFVDNDFVLITPTADLDEETGLLYASVSGAYIQDRTYSTTPSSGINYKTEGEAGNRILKLEVKNAGLEDARYLGFSEDHFYLNFQIWLYENNNVIEYRYGNHNITTISVLDDLVQVGFVDDNFGSVLTGSATQPAYQEFNFNTNPPDEDFEPTLTAYPGSGTVYRFAPAATADIKTFSKNTFTIYPNPAEAELNVTKTGGTANYEVYSILGSKVLSGTIDTANTTINVANLDKGVYLVKIGNAVQKFIKK